MAASAVHLPLRPQTFDAIVHTDVLCCLRAKLAVLKECHAMLKPGGRMAFTTIYAAPGVDERSYRRACRVRGCGFAERRQMTGLMNAAGFVAVKERDVTREFARTTRAYLETSARHETELSDVWGADRYRDWQHDRAATLALIEEGVVRRGLFTARRGARG
jgi:cyclopropane fatty-acyl-phospholipid synthase-like methyltransferase